MHKAYLEVICIADEEEKHVYYLDDKWMEAALPHLPVLKTVWENLECTLCKPDNSLPKSDPYKHIPIHHLPITQISLTCLYLCIGHKAKVPEMKWNFAKIACLCEGIHYLNGSFDSMQPLFASIKWNKLSQKDASHIRKICDVLNNIKSPPLWMCDYLRTIHPNVFIEVYSDLCQQHKTIQWLFQNLNCKCLKTKRALTIVEEESGKKRAL